MQSHNACVMAYPSALLCLFVSYKSCCTSSKHSVASFSVEDNGFNITQTFMLNKTHLIEIISLKLEWHPAGMPRAP
jgi:hypothetical protein